MIKIQLDHYSYVTYHNGVCYLWSASTDTFIRELDKYETNFIVKAYEAGVDSCKPLLASLENGRNE